MKILVSVVAMLLELTASRAVAESVPVGVYDCYGPSMVGGRGSEVEGAGRQGRDAYTSESAGRGAVGGMGSKFAVVASDRYLSRGGKTGRFSFDGLTLTMVDGPYTGLRYHKATPAWTFRALRENGVEGPVMCPRNTTKDRNNPNAW